MTQSVHVIICLIDLAYYFTNWSIKDRPIKSYNTDNSFV